MKNKSEKLTSKTVIKDIVDNYFQVAATQRIVVLHNADPKYIKLITRVMKNKANKLEVMVHTADANEPINLQHNGDILVIRDPTSKIGSLSKPGWYTVDVGALLNYAHSRTSRQSRAGYPQPF